MTFSLPSYTYFPTWKRLLLSLSCFVFVQIFFFFFISTLDWCICDFFRILFWVAIWFCLIKLLSLFFLFFFSMIVKCYSIAYKYNLQEYNVILLYIMTWIIWCLTYDYIFYFDVSFSHFIFYFSLEKGDYSLSLSLSIYIYILFIIFCNFTLGWWIIVFFI